MDYMSQTQNEFMMTKSFVRSLSYDVVANFFGTKTNATLNTCKRHIENAIVMKKCSGLVWDKQKNHFENKIKGRLIQNGKKMIFNFHFHLISLVRILVMVNAKKRNYNLNCENDCCSNEMKFSCVYLVKKIRSKSKDSNMIHQDDQKNGKVRIHLQHQHWGMLFYLIFNLS